MNKKIIFVADFFANNVLGGGELNNRELIEILQENDFSVQRIYSNELDQGFIRKNLDNFFIISNFVGMQYDCRELIAKEVNYIIYEHDHKYVTSRNPGHFENFKAPSSEIRNYFFYKNARQIICQSNFHKEIIEKNLEIDNVISVGGNLWSVDTLNRLRALSQKEKAPKCSIMNSRIPHKNTYKAQEYCEEKGLKYELISAPDHDQFLEKLGRNKTLIFFPGTPETLSRVVVEARMMGMSVITNSLVGATNEEWFKLKGAPLIDCMIDKRKEIYSIVKDLIFKDFEKPKKPLVSIITTFHEGEKYLNNFMDNITNQTIFGDCELIIVDANSKGTEEETIKKYSKKHHNIVYVRLDEKLAVTPSLNLAIQRSESEFITFAFLDDVKAEDCVEKLYNSIVEDSEVDLVYGDVYQTAVPNETFNESFDYELFDHSQFKFSKENMVKCLPGPMPLWRKLMHERNGFLDTTISVPCDWEMWLRAVASGSRFKKINDIVGLYLVGGRSQQNKTKVCEEEAKIFFKYSHVFGSNYNKYEPYFKQFVN